MKYRVGKKEVSTFEFFHKSLVKMYKERMERKKSITAFQCFFWGKHNHEFMFMNAPVLLCEQHRKSHCVLRKRYNVSYDRAFDTLFLGIMNSWYRY